MERKKHVHYGIVINDIKNQISSKEIKKAVEEYIIKYRKCKIQLECFNAISLFNNQEVSKEALQDYVKYIEKVIDYISYQSKEILTNEYILDKKDYWWKEKYTRSTFFKLRQNAFIEFLSYVN